MQLSTLAEETLQGKYVFEREVMWTHAYSSESIEWKKDFLLKAMDHGFYAMLPTTFCAVAIVHPHNSHVESRA